IDLAPKFDERGLIPAVTTDYETGELLMHGYMNAEALERTIETGEAHYYSRSRQALWHKGATSGLVQRVRELLIDDDQDCVWLRVDVAGGASCHVGYRSCFYRRVPLGSADGPVRLEFTEREKVFDPKEVYGDAPNPTKLQPRKLLSKIRARHEFFENSCQTPFSAKFSLPRRRHVTRPDASISPRSSSHPRAKRASPRHHAPAEPSRKL